MQRILASAALAAAALLCLAPGCRPQQQERAAAEADTTVPTAAAAPFVLDHNRMMVDVEFVRADGSLRAATAWVDTGTQFLTLTGPLAEDLGLKLTTETGSDGRTTVTAPPPRGLHLAGASLDLTGIATIVQGDSVVWPAIHAEATLPAAVFRGRRVVFDYPGLTIALPAPDAPRPEGTAIPCRVNGRTGLIQIEAEADGEPIQLGVDTGSAGTWVSRTVVESWLARHPDWPRATGAAGSANFFGFPSEAEGVLVRLPELGLGPLRARDVTVLGQRPGMFDWYSQKTAGSVAGFIGANVLRGYRLEIDSPRGMTTWLPGPPPPAGDLDIVGLTLRPLSAGGFIVSGLVRRNGEPVVAGVLSGDRLRRVDGLDADGAHMGDVIQALRGRPGASRTLVVEHEGKRLTVQAQVVRLP